MKAFKNFKMIGINPAKSRIMEAIENKSKTINMRETLLTRTMTKRTLRVSKKIGRMI